MMHLSTEMREGQEGEWVLWGEKKRRGEEKEGGREKGLSPH